MACLCMDVRFSFTTPWGQCFSPDGHLSFMTHCFSCRIGRMLSNSRTLQPVHCFNKTYKCRANACKTVCLLMHTCRGFIKITVCLFDQLVQDVPEYIWPKPLTFTISSNDFTLYQCKNSKWRTPYCTMLLPLSNVQLDNHLRLRHAWETEM